MEAASAPEPTKVDEPNAKKQRLSLRREKEPDRFALSSVDRPKWNGLRLGLRDVCVRQHQEGLGLVGLGGLKSRGSFHRVL